MLLKLFIQKLSKVPALNINIILFLLVSNTVVGQLIRGNVKNHKGEKINNANIVVKDSINAQSILAFCTTKNGEYRLELPSDLKKALIEITADKYKKDIWTLEDIKKSNIYTHNFILEKDSVVELQEVTVSTKALPFTINGDTTKFNVSKYSNGTERKIIDIIKVLPGIEVNNKTGEITYKGKPIETVNLEGDNLFGFNYAIGTKNINVDMVEEVQVIENFSENPLLKGIDSNDKIALNLKLKKAHLDVSGSIDIALGASEGRDIAQNHALNLLGITQNYKSFGTASYNNIGQNNSPFDYFSTSQNVEQIRDKNILAKPIISDIIISNNLDEKRTNINNAVFSNYNGLIKLHKRVSIKGNLYFLNDRISSIQSIENTNFLPQGILATSDNYLSAKEPHQARGDLELQSILSDQSSLEYKIIFDNTKSYAQTNILQNTLNTQSAQLNTHNHNFKQSLLFTNRLTDKHALQFLASLSSNDINQNFTLNLVSESSNNIDSTFNQVCRNRKNTFQLQAILMGRANNKSKYSFSIGNYVEQTSFESLLYNSSDKVISTNDFTYTTNNLYNHGIYEINLRRLRISTSLKGRFFTQKLGNLFQENFIIEPSLLLKLKLNPIAILGINSSLSQKNFTEESLFSNPIILSNRLFASSKPVLSLQKLLVINLVYSINNLYQQFRLNASINYLKNHGSYFSNISINRRNSYLEYFFSSKPNENITADFLVEKYLPILNSTIRLKSNYAFSNYYNVVNASDLRLNNNHYITLELFAKTAFDYKVNFENSLVLINNHSQNIASKQSIQNNALQNTFKIIFKPNKQWFFITNLEYLIPNKNFSKDYVLFCDAYLKYRPIKRKYEFRLDGQNLFNMKYFFQTNTSDYSINTFKSNLISRYFLASVIYNF